MITPDNTRVYIPCYLNDRKQAALIKSYKAWFRERNIKYSFCYNPAWGSSPDSVILRNEDALLFKLSFGL